MQDIFQISMFVLSSVLSCSDMEEAPLHWLSEGGGVFSETPPKYTENKKG